MLSRQETKQLPPGPPARRGKGCTDLPCLLLFMLCLGTMGWIVYLSLQPPSDIRRIIHGLDSQHDLCGVDNSDPDEPRHVTVTVGRPSPFWRLWPFGEASTPHNITVLRGARDHTARPFLYFTFPTGSLGGVPSSAVCVSECPSPPVLANGTAATGDDPSSYVCTGQYYGTPADRCSGAPSSPASTADREGGVDGNSTASTTNVASASCAAPPASTLFSQVGAEELARCDDALQECTVRAVPAHTHAHTRARGVRGAGRQPLSLATFFILALTSPAMPQHALRAGVLPAVPNRATAALLPA